VYDYLTLISRREDADTLFFQRRLKMEGDTELGLYVKNLLDGLDVESLSIYEPADFIVQRGVSLYERLFR
jgi:predicted lipid carrier protein YhbT